MGVKKASELLLMIFFGNLGQRRYTGSRLFHSCVVRDKELLYVTLLRGIQREAKKLILKVSLKLFI